LTIKGLPNVGATEILRKYLSIIKFGLIIFDSEYSHNSYILINNLISRLAICHPTGSAAVAMQLSEIYFGCQEMAYIDSLLYLQMIESQWRAEDCALKIAAFLTHSSMPPQTRIGFEALRKEGLEVLWLEGPEASDVMEYWAFTVQWNCFLTQVLTYAKLVPWDSGPILKLQRHYLSY
jgi:hypothetical protein